MSDVVLTREMDLEEGAKFGPTNAFYSTSTLPFQAPPFDRIVDADFLPAMEAGMAEQSREIDAIANSAEAPTFENTLEAMEKTGLLFDRVMGAFHALTGANTNPVLQKVEEYAAPRLSAHRDSILLNAKLFARVANVYAKRDALKLDAESARLLEVQYRRFVHAGAKLSEEQKTQLRRLNEEESMLQNAFNTRLLAATKEAALQVTDDAVLSGLTEAQIRGAAAEAKQRGLEGYVLQLHNTTQQPLLADLTDRATRCALFERSWRRAEISEEDGTRGIVARIAQLRAEKARLQGSPNYAAWSIEDQMAKSPEAALMFLQALVPGAVARVRKEAADIQAVIDEQEGGFRLQAADWNFYAEQVRQAKFDLNEAELKPYFEVNRVMERGLFFAAQELYGLRFTERKDLPLYHPDVRVFEVTEASGDTLALFYCDWLKRDNKRGGAWMSEFVGQSRLLGTIPVVYNVANFTKPAAGEPALISFDDVTTMFHEFGHALHGMFSDATYPSLAGTSVARDFVEFPSQFHEHWATYPTVFRHYATHYETGAAMPEELAAKLKKAATFNQGYRLTELLAAALLDLQWHTLPAGEGALKDPDVFEREALEAMQLWVAEVPPRYRSSFFAHIWNTGYAAGYYAYLWSESLEYNAYQWFEDHGGLTRANGDRLRTMVLSRGNTEDLETMYARWLGKEPAAGLILKHRGLDDEDTA